MTAPRLRVHLINQGFSDYVDGLRRGLAPITDLRSSTVTTQHGRPPTQSRLDTTANQFYCRRFRDPRSPLDAIGALRALRRLPADVVHYQAAGNPWVDAAASVVGFAAPLVVTVHDLTAHPGDTTVLPGTFRAIHRLIRRADAVIFHSAHQREQALAMGLAADAIAVIPHGELGSVYRTESELPLPPSAGRQILFFGRIQGYKGLDVLIEAMAKVRRALPDAELLIAGRGDLPPPMEATPWIRVDNRFISRDEVADVFASSAVVALPYLEASQSGVATLAAGFGRAVVASAVGGLNESVVDNHTGMLVAPADPDALADGITQLLRDDERRHDMETAAYCHATTTLSWDTIAQQTHEVYTQVIDSSRPSRPHR